MLARLAGVGGGARFGPCGRLQDFRAGGAFRGTSGFRAAATMSARRSGIIIRIPISPPSTATSMTRAISRSNPRIMIAGIVTPRPNAIDSPADPAVCTILFSRSSSPAGQIFEKNAEEGDRDDCDGIKHLP